MRLRVLLALSTVRAEWLSAQSRTESPSLVLGRKLECELSAGRSQEHYALLGNGQYARFNIAQLTVNISVAVFDAAGRQVCTGDNSSIGEAEEGEFITTTSGKYRLRVTASEAHAPAGR